jgi:hypothetical protein
MSALVSTDTLADVVTFRIPACPGLLRLAPCRAGRIIAIPSSGPLDVRRAEIRLFQKLSTSMRAN